MEERSGVGAVEVTESSPVAMPAEHRPSSDESSFWS